MSGLVLSIFCLCFEQPYTIHITFSIVSDTGVLLPWAKNGKNAISLERCILHSQNYNLYKSTRHTTKVEQKEIYNNIVNVPIHTRIRKGITLFSKVFVYTTVRRGYDDVLKFSAEKSLHGYIYRSEARSVMYANK